MDADEHFIQSNSITRFAKTLRKVVWITTEWIMDADKHFTQSHSIMRRNAYTGTLRRDWALHGMDYDADEYFAQSHSIIK